MKIFKRSNAYGAFEYSVIIALVILIALIVLRNMKGKVFSFNGLIGSVTNQAESIFGSEDILDPTGIKVEYSGAFLYDYDQEFAFAMQNYFIDSATVKDQSGSIREDYELKDISRLENFAQVDVHLDGESKREKILIVDNCLIADDSHFSGEPNINSKYIGTHPCVIIPNEINGQELVSYEGMFAGTNIKKVISSNENIKYMGAMFYGLNSNTLDISRLNTSNVEDFGWMFGGCDLLEIVGINKMDTSSATTMSGMFESLKIAHLNLFNFNTLNVSDMSHMFENSQIMSIVFGVNFNTLNVVNMEGMFAHAQVPSLNLSSFNTSNVTNMSSMFAGSSSLSIDVSNFNTGNVESMTHMFRGSSVESLDLSKFNTENVTNMDRMFHLSKVKELDLSSFSSKSLIDELVIDGEDSWYEKGASWMFHTSEIERLIFGENFKLEHISYLGNIFRNSNINELDISNLDFTKSKNAKDPGNEALRGLDAMFFGSSISKIYVKDEQMKILIENIPAYLRVSIEEIVVK